MKISQKSMGQGIVWALIIALAAAAVPTFIDWSSNPGGVFQGADGTNWNAVIETLWSWLWPLFTAATPITILFHAWLADRETKNAGLNPGRRDQ